MGYDYNHVFDAWEGFFKAPTSGQYRFLMSCDDSCSLKMTVPTTDNPTVDTLDASQKTTLLYNPQVMGYRDTDIPEKTADSEWLGNRFSEWYTLTEGEYYFFESTFYQANGPAYTNVGMEVRPDVFPSSHPKLESQVLRMSMGQTNILYDTLEVIVTGADQGIFLLAYLIPDDPDGEYWRSEEITAGGDASSF